YFHLLVKGGNRELEDHISETGLCIAYTMYMYLKNLKQSIIRDKNLDMYNVWLRDDKAQREEQMNTWTTFEAQHEEDGGAPKRVEEDLEKCATIVDTLDIISILHLPSTPQPIVVRYLDGVSNADMNMYGRGKSKNFSEDNFFDSNFHRQLATHKLDIVVELLTNLLIGPSGKKKEVLITLLLSIIFFLNHVVVILKMMQIIYSTGLVLVFFESSGWRLALVTIYAYVFKQDLKYIAMTLSLMIVSSLHIILRNEIGGAIIWVESLEYGWHGRLKKHCLFTILLVKANRSSSQAIKGIIAHMWEEGLLHIQISNQKTGTNKPITSTGRGNSTRKNIIPRYWFASSKSKGLHETNNSHIYINIYSIGVPTFHIFFWPEQYNKYPTPVIIRRT
ncbi:hypothetical protein ACJX0J_026413, partial [Zea mays]